MGVSRCVSVYLGYYLWVVVRLYSSARARQLRPWGGEFPSICEGPGPEAQVWGQGWDVRKEGDGEEERNYIAAGL